MTNFFIETLGCQMNVFDSQRIADLLIKQKYTEVQNPELADIYMINTCAVRENAANKFMGHLGKLKKVKEDKPNLILIVVGCLSQKIGDELFKAKKFIDIIIGTHNISSLPTLIQKFQDSKKRQIELLESNSDNEEYFTDQEKDFHKYVTISTGCDQRCSFCIVPSVRGDQIDRPIEEILDDVKKYQKIGIKEITLLGQNVNAYGKGSNSYSFAQLLEEVANLGIPRIRFMSPHPGFFSNDVADTIAKHPNIMPYLHLPLQSGSNQVLKSMNRGYTVEKYQKIVERLKEKIPNIIISSDIIVGYPTETQEDFEQTLQAIEKFRFLFVYSFIYSARPDTKSEKLINELDSKKIKENFQKLTELQDKITLEEMNQFLNQEVEVLVYEVTDVSELDGRTVEDDGSKANYKKNNQSEANQGNRKERKKFTGRTKHNILVHFDSAQELTPGDLLTVKINRVAPHNLFGEQIKNQKKFEKKGVESVKEKGSAIKKVAEEGNVYAKQLEKQAQFEEKAKGEVKDILDLTKKLTPEQEKRANELLKEYNITDEEM